MAEHSTVNRRVTGSSPVGGANIARAPERSSGALAIYVPLARTSNPSGLRPRRDNGFYFLARSEKPSPRCIESRATENCGGQQRWFLARSENLRLASSSPVGTFSPNRVPVTPRACALGGITVFTSSRARKNRHPAVSSPVGTFSPSRE